MLKVTGILALFCLVTLTSSSAEEVPQTMRAMIEKTQSFGVGHYPISFWSYTNLKQHGSHMTEAEVESWADAGFTVPQSPSLDPSRPEEKAHLLKILDWSHARGMKLIVCDPRTGARQGEPGQPAPDYRDSVKQAVSDFGGHPATFGFHVGDEPDADMKEAFFSCYKVQKEIAPTLHPFANLLPYFPGIQVRAGSDTWPHYLDEFVADSQADLISYDCYAQMNPGQGGWQNYYENLRLYREAALRNGVPFWNTLLSVGHFRYRCPNYDELRWQFNTTVASGAHGILWFFYYMRMPHDNYRFSPVDEHWDKTQTYWDIRKIQKSFHRRYKDLFTRLACTKVMFFPEAFGGGQVFAPDGVVSELKPDAQGHPLLLGEFVDLQGRGYAMLVNNSMTDSVNARLTFPGKDVKIFSWDWDGNEVEGGAYCSSNMTRGDSGVTLTHWLAPGQEAVYRVESESAMRDPM